MVTKILGRHDIHHNDTQHNDIQHNDVQRNDIQQNDTQSAVMLSFIYAKSQLCWLSVAN